MLRPVRALLVIGLMLAALLVAGGILAVGKPGRTPVPTVELRAETTEVTTTEEREDPKERSRRTGSVGSGGGSGAKPAPSPAPVPAGDDDDDDDRDEN